MDYTFNINGESYWGSDRLDESAPAYAALDCGNDLIDKFRAYYSAGFGKQLPRPRLFVIQDARVNAFAVFEQALGEYCIGICYGAFQRISEKVEETVDMVIERSAGLPAGEELISREKRDTWVDFVYINAMRFFVAHEYAHILCGHVDMSGAGHFEFADGMLSEDENLFRQMKEFDADESAMSILCYMTRSSFETGYRIHNHRVNQTLQANRGLIEYGLPEVLINMRAQDLTDSLRRAYEAKVEGIRRHFKYLMLGVNIVFLVLDERRTGNLWEIADSLGIPEAERGGFCFSSGLRLIRAVDHPIPALRLDAVIRIMDECIELCEGGERAEEIFFEITNYVWEVEFLRCDHDITRIYLNIAHTPTAQDFMGEIEDLWQNEKTRFTPYIEQMKRLFYVNRIVHMSDDGEMLLP